MEIDPPRGSSAVSQAQISPMTVHPKTTPLTHATRTARRPSARRQATTMGGKVTSRYSPIRVAKNPSIR